jgi:hypothetical protein
MRNDPSRPLRRLLLAAALALPLAHPPATARAADAPPGEVRALIDQLGDADFARRDAAATKLRAIGKPALPALKEALTHPDAEVVTRAQALIKRIEVRPVPAPDPAVANGPLGTSRMRLSVVNGNRVYDVSEGGRDVRITEGPDGIVMVVTGLIGNERGTEEFTARDAEQLKAEHPEAHALFERWTGGGGPGAVIGGRIRLGGAGGIQINRVRPPAAAIDEVDQLRARLDKQMRDAHVKDAGRAAVNRAVEQLAAARATGPIEKYTEQADAARKVFEEHKLDPGELLPPPAKARLGVQVSTEDGRLFVMQVQDNSRAQRLGLKPGDQIRKIAGKDLATVAELRKVVTANEAGLTVDVTRDGQELKLEEKVTGPPPK